MQIGESENYTQVIYNICYTGDGDAYNCPTNVARCRSKAISYLECSPYYSEAICIELVAEACFFDLD